MASETKKITYLMIIRPSDGSTLLEKCLIKKKKKIKEAKKVGEKLITSELESDQRKKIVSPKYGVWIGECCKLNLLHICLLDYGTSEDFATEFLRRSKKELYKSDIEADHISVEDFKEKLEDKIFGLIDFFNSIDEDKLEDLKEEDLNKTIPQTELNESVPGSEMVGNDEEKGEEGLLGEGDGESTKAQEVEVKEEEKEQEAVGEPIETEEKEKEQSRIKDEESIQKVNKKVDDIADRVRQQMMKAGENNQDLDVRRFLIF
jgi:hypothetical protein